MARNLLDQKQVFTLWSFLKNAAPTDESPMRLESWAEGARKASEHLKFYIPTSAFRRAVLELEIPYRLSERCAKKAQRASESRKYVLRVMELENRCKRLENAFTELCKQFGLEAIPEGWYADEEA